MFSLINCQYSSFGYTTSIKHIRNVYSLQTDITYEYTNCVNGYLDDTTWYSYSLDSLNTLLDLTNSFYKLANIKVNINKYKIMTTAHITSFYNTIKNPTHLTKIICLLNKYNFNFLPNFSLSTIGGSTPIHNYINNLTSNDIQSLCNKHILFIDQVVLSDGYYLLTWDEVKEKHSSKYSGPIPKWFLRLEQDFTLSQYR
ncbi:hypothetical protein RclHR1_03350016 [Rhizophagus clarus]|uniref:Reverse transcriptase domain-containing protein n=1 Tax=Rhizophagus clarus TaxID=94130 RepID=A0A2Z6R9C0_9GLOM|nr:hypothetical protein RclHR1_03350016 [Rhizophagus clarus]